MRIKTFRVEKMIIWKINDLLNNLASYFQGSIYHQDSSSQMLTEQVIIFHLVVCTSLALPYDMSTALPGAGL